ncbi:mono-functional DNA-alkylating methyl methanesulfonate N-term-domain-containing protein [Helicostylum pulchrum]|nr:mono-functional DNA-alkylating methyl methanesulfonate N-term-domain-containing protein [Helicostylum pulchrum]
MTIGPVTESDPNLLKRQLQQSTFGTIIDTQLLRCLFTETADTTTTATTLEEEFYEDIPYSKKIRNHAMIQGRDVLVALSEYGKLMFMTIHSDLDLGVKRFETMTEVYLDSPGLEYTKVGKKLAVDPYSRAIAIGSFQDFFDILILNETMSRVKFDPIIGRGSECEMGIIWHMEFLYTETTSMERILLALVIYNDIDRSCRIVIYEIDASNIDNVTIDKVGRLPLERNTPLPLLLIPLKFRPEAFLLVTEQQVCLLTADDLTCGNVLYPSTPIPKQFKSTECPLFTAYASHLDSTQEYIYLGSAEGCLYRLEISSTGEMTWTTIEQTNQISQSMCMLGTINMMDQNNDNEITNADIILYSGESADSQVIAVKNLFVYIYKKKVSFFYSCII